MWERAVFTRVLYIHSGNVELVEEDHGEYILLQPRVISRICELWVMWMKKPTKKAREGLSFQKSKEGLRSQSDADFVEMQ